MDPERQSGYPTDLMGLETVASDAQAASGGLVVQ